MFSNSARRLAVQNTSPVVFNNMRYFGVLPKLPKIELTLRTPYNTLFKDFSNFARVYVGT